MRAIVNRLIAQKNYFRWRSVPSESVFQMWHSDDIAETECITSFMYDEL
jgi:hypothetical protein